MWRICILYFFSLPYPFWLFICGQCFEENLEIVPLNYYIYIKSPVPLWILKGVFLCTNFRFDKKNMKQKGDYPFLLLCQTFVVLVKSRSGRGILLWVFLAFLSFGKLTQMPHFENFRHFCNFFLDILTYLPLKSTDQRSI